MLSTVPDVIFKTRIRDASIGGDNPFRWQDVSTDDIFKGKKIVVLALPGAFTPTCSSKHLSQDLSPTIRLSSIKALTKCIA